MRPIHTATMIFGVAMITLLLLSFGIETGSAMTIEKEAFGTTPDGTAVDLYTLRNDNGIEVQITNYEGILLSVLAPDKEGNLEDIVLGYATLAEYIKYDPYFGGITDKESGRFENLV